MALETFALLAVLLCVLPGSVPGRLVLPNYAIMVALACVSGACGYDDQPAGNATCPGSIHLVLNGTGTRGAMCNNATLDWLVRMLVAQVAIEKEQVAEKTAIISDMRASNLHTEDEVNLLVEEKVALEEDNARLRDQNLHAFHELDALRTTMSKDLLRPMDCGDVQRFGFGFSGLYTIYPRGLEQGVHVFCDLNTAGGGWTLVQRREDGAEDFACDWAQYKAGFGSVSKDFWLGNDCLAVITMQRQYTLRVDMTDYEGITGHATYATFSVDTEHNKYRLRVTGYSGDAGDALGPHDGFRFTTRDRDHDRSRSGHCSQLFGNGGWWYGRCYDSNLNGLHGRDHGNQGVVWFQWKDDYTPQRRVRMMIRPVGF